MALTTLEQNFYHLHANTNSRPQFQLPQTFRNSFDLIFDERRSGNNYNYIRPFLSYQEPKPKDFSDPLVTPRTRRPRTTFTNDQLALLEYYFLKGRYLTTPRLLELSEKLHLSTAQVKIWFKNRRRRHKVQSNQRNEFLYDDMSLSPPATSNEETNENNSNICGSSDLPSSSVGKPNLPSVSLNDRAGSAPKAVTPSPPEKIPTANYGNHVFGSHYYNNHQDSSHLLHQHNSTNHANVLSAHAYATFNTQYHPLPSSSNSVQCHEHRQPYHATHRDQLPVRDKSQVTSIEQDTTYNFDNPYYSPIPRPLTTNSTITTVQSESLSPNSDDYEPLKQKNNKSSSQWHGTGSRHGDTIDDLNGIKTILRVLENNNSNGDICGNKNGIRKESYANPAYNIMAKQCRNVAADVYDTNYLYGMDTLIYHRSLNFKNSTNFQQLATY